MPRFDTVVELDRQGLGGDNVYEILGRCYAVLRRVGTEAERGEFGRAVDACAGYDEVIELVKRWFGTRGEAG